MPKVCLYGTFLGSLRQNLKSLIQDLLYNWDTTNSMSLFPPCKEFEGKWVNRTKNRHIFSCNLGSLHQNLKSRSQDLLYNWDTTNSVSLFPPCKEFEGKWVNRTKNRHIFSGNFCLVPNIEQLIYEFEDQFKNITVDNVSLTQKLKTNDGF